MNLTTIWTQNKYFYKAYHEGTSLVGNITHKPMIKTTWAIKVLNAGDLVAPLLLRRYGFTPAYSYRNEAQLFSAGSLLDRVPESFSGFILGTGFMHGNVIRSLPKARILAVRGELTRKNVNAPKDTILGDPGLIVASSMQRRQEKRYELGIVPHFSDKHDPRLQKLIKKYMKEILIINIQASPIRVLNQMDQCSHIISSSLHGVIFANSLGIPNMWTILSGKVQGEGFKFHDYRSGLNWQQDPVSISGDERLGDLIKQTGLPPQEEVELAKKNLQRAYELFKQEMSSLQQTETGT